MTNILAIVLAMVAGPACAQTTTFYSDTAGRPVGSPDRFGDVTFYNDAHGRPAGSSTRFGSQTFYNGPNGEPAGSSMTFGGEDGGDE